MIKLFLLHPMVLELETLSLVSPLVAQILDQMAKFRALPVIVVVNICVARDDGPVSVVAKPMLVEAVIS